MTAADQYVNVILNIYQTFTYSPYWVTKHFEINCCEFSNVQVWHCSGLLNTHGCNLVSYQC